VKKIKIILILTLFHIVTNGGGVYLTKECSTFGLSLVEGKFKGDIGKRLWKKIV